MAERESLTPELLAHLRDLAAVDDEKFATYIATADVRTLLAAYDALTAERDQALASLAELAALVKDHRDLPPDYPSKGDRLATLLRALRALCARHADKGGTHV
jgi:hypothetical protein